MYPRFAFVIICFIALISFCFAGDTYLAIVEADQTGMAEYPGRCWGKTLSKIYLFADELNLEWLDQRAISYTRQAVDIDLNPVIYINYGDVEQLSSSRLGLLDISDDYVVSLYKLPQAKQSKPMEIRNLPLDKPPEGPSQPMVYNSLVDSLIGEVSTDSIIDRLEKLSGEETVVVGGQTVTIDTRYSGSSDNELAAQFIYETLENYGYDAEYHAFYSGTLRHVAAASGNRAWTVDEGSEALRTIDGGSNWSYQASGTSERLYSVDFIDSLDGWIVGWLGTVLHTTNGGDSWQSIDLGDYTEK